MDVNVLSLSFVLMSVSAMKYPMNRAVMEGETVEFSCTASAPGLGVIWSFQREDFIDEIIHSHNYEQTIFGKRITVNKRRDVQNWDYVLIIEDVRIYDAGIYFCTDNDSTNRRYSALLNVMRLPRCSSDQSHAYIKYECKLYFNNYLEIIDTWLCNVEEEIVHIASEKSLLELNHPESGASVAYQELKTSVKLMKQTPGYGDFDLKCNLSVHSNIDDFLIPGWAVNLDTMLPNFTMLVSPVVSLRFNISTGYNLLVDEVITCTGDSLLNISYHIITSDRDFKLGNTIFFSTGNKTIDIICYGKTDLNLEPIRHEIRDITIHAEYPIKRCEDAGLYVCYRTYFQYIDENDIFVRISRAYFTEVCTMNYHVTIDCVRKVMPCYMSERDIGIMQSYIFLCQNNYLEHRRHFLNVPLYWDCKRKYIQQLGLTTHLNQPDKFLKNTGFVKRDKPKLLDIIRRSCNYLADGIDIHCSAIAVKVYGSIEASRWHTEFFSRLRFQRTRNQEAMIQLKHYFNKIIVATDECNYDRLSIEQRQICDAIQKCYGLWKVLLSITDFGIIFITNMTEFEKVICYYDEKFIRYCVDEYLPYCPPKSRIILDPIAVLHELLCFDYRKAYKNHHDCFAKIYDRFKLGLNCAGGAMTKFSEFYDGMDESIKKKIFPEEETQLCNIALEYLDCIQVFFEGFCGSEAAQLQRLLARRILAEAFRGFYCFLAFSHKSEFLMDHSNCKIIHFNNYFSMPIFVVIFYYLVYEFWYS